MNEFFTLLWAMPTYSASDGTVYAAPGLAFLHDLVEQKWQRLLPVLKDPQVLAQTRRDLHLSQSELAKAAGISCALLSMIESGQRKVSEKMVQRLWGAMWRIDQARKAYTTPEIMLRIENECSLVTTQIEKLNLGSEAKL